MVTNNAINLATAASGKVLQGAGIGTALAFSTPTYPSTSGTSRKILVSDGTNNVYSTETWAVPGTSGNLLTSDGTNWTSAAASAGSFLTASVTLTNAQIKALHATPVQIVAAPGTGKGLVLVSATAKLNYGGTTAFTAGAAQTIDIYYNNNTTLVKSLITNAFIVSTANKFTALPNLNATNSNQVAGILDNVNLAAWNSVATEITGDAANDSTISLNVSYWVVTY